MTAASRRPDVAVQALTLAADVRLRIVGQRAVLQGVGDRIAISGEAAGRRIDDTVSMSCSSITASTSNDSISGRARPGGMGVTRPIHRLAIVGVSYGIATMIRRRSPASCA